MNKLALPQEHWLIKPGMDSVAAVFSRLLAEQDEEGAAFSAYYQGQPLVDLWGGFANREQEQLWQADTLQLIFSATKAITSIAIHQLAEQGLLDLTSPIARYWPEFAAVGKENISIEQVLTHRAGLARVDASLTAEQLWDWQPVIDAIALQPANFEPGSQQAYHARTFGWILGELIQRVTGLAASDYIQQAIVQPLGLDLQLGVAAGEEGRAAYVYADPVPPGPAASDYQRQVMIGPGETFINHSIWNSTGLQQAQMPSSNAFATARSLAKMMAATLAPVAGVQLISDESRQDAARVRTFDKDLVMGVEMPFGLGFMGAPAFGSLPSATSFGHLAAGGGFVLADPERQLAMAFTPNRMRSGPAAELRRQRLIKSLYSALEKI